MKKNLIIMSMTALILTGCSGDRAKISNPEVEVGGIKDHNVTADDLYQEMIENGGNGLTAFYSIIDQYILDDQYPRDDEKVASEYTELYEQYEEYYSSQGSSLKDMLKNNGETEESFSDSVYNSVQLQMAIKKYVTESVVTDEDIKTEYKERGEKNRASIITVTVPETDAEGKTIETAEAQTLATEKINSILKRLNDGEDFAKVAAETSEQETTAAKGGDLGYFYENEQEKIIVTKVKSLKTGDYTKEYFETSYGYTIVMKTEDPVTPSLEDDKKAIIDKLVKNEMTSNDYSAATQIALRKEYGMVINDEVLKNQYSIFQENSKEN